MRNYVFARTIGIFPLAAILGFACNSSDTEAEGGNTDDPTELQSQALISDCGGFSATPDAALPIPSPSTGGMYCQPNVLSWEYEAEAQSLVITDTAVRLNCCGNHSMDIVQTTEGDYVVTEQDSPIDEEGARCGCDCTFDFELTVPNIEGDAVSIELVRNVTDEYTKTVWTGEWTLADGEGSIVLKEPSTADCGK